MCPPDDQSNESSNHSVDETESPDQREADSRPPDQTTEDESGMSRLTRRAGLGAMGGAAVAIGGWYLFGRESSDSDASNEGTPTEETPREGTPRDGTPTETEAAIFEVDILKPVDGKTYSYIDNPGWDTEVVASVTNVGDLEADQDIVINSSSDFDEPSKESVTLAPGESTTVRFSVYHATEASITVSSNDDSDSVTVETEIVDVWPGEGGRLTYGLFEPADTTNPFLSNSVSASMATMFVYEPLLRRDPVTFDWRPWILDDWALRKEGLAKPEVVLSVRSDESLGHSLLWNDGTEFTVEDVLFSYQYVNEQEPDALDIHENYEWTELDESDEWDIRVKLSEQFGDWEAAVLDMPVFPKHIWEEVGDDWESYVPHEEGGPVGLGPGVITEWRPDRSIEVDFTGEESGRPDDWEYSLTKLDWYENHDKLVNEGPYLGKLLYFIYPDIQTANESLLQSDVDTIYETQPETIEDIRDDDRLKLVQGFGSGFSYANWNHHREPLNDICLRQAMAFVWDDILFVDQLKNQTVRDGDIAYSPGYTGVRPETVFFGELLDDPAVEAYAFRPEEEGSTEPDVEAIRSFMENDEIIDGTEDTYVGQDYPGSLSGVNATYNESLFEYSFGPVNSSLLQDQVEQELYVDGEPFSEFYDHGETIDLLLRSPDENPDIRDAMHRWAEHVRKLGIPMTIEMTTADELSETVFHSGDFDLYEHTWDDQLADGSSAYHFFHSDRSSETVGEDVSAPNASGYGNFEQYQSGTADNLIEEARQTHDQLTRQELWATALERAYLDVAYMVYSYPIVDWPLPEWAHGEVEGLIDPSYDSLWTQIMNLYDERE